MLGWHLVGLLHVLEMFICVNQWDTSRFAIIFQSEHCERNECVFAFNWNPVDFAMPPKGRKNGINANRSFAVILTMNDEYRAVKPFRGELHVVMWRESTVILYFYWMLK